MTKIVLKRVPPGDRWSEVTGNRSIGESSTKDVVGENLTEALQYVYGKYKVRVFTVDANEGTVSIDDGVKKPIRKYSLYGD